MRGVKLKCNECNYEASFSWGFAMLSPPEEYEKEEKAVSDFKAEVENGEHGDFLKTVCTLHENPQFLRGERLMQCGSCYALLVHRIKEIRFHQWNDPHTHVVTMRQQCPVCGENELYKADLHPLCPKCKGSFLKTISLWME
ncbi:MAG: hypothetical protein IKK51_10465 [Oscillospiraceae bacterium]|nr:hypothetical protein [Oscillospiraceae bacterium]